MNLIGVHPIKESDLGFNRQLFGGKLLYWIDGDAAAYAMQISDTPRMVTVSMDKCVFRRKTTQSHIIKIYAEIKEFGTTSVTLEVEARRHNVYNGKQEVILSTDIKFVRVDEDGYPLPITSKTKQKFKLGETFNKVQSNNNKK
tara:strand:+ start:208 stop:636 length:429 start_codon:yes stop_codon:yes gene_type:complete